MQLIKRYWKILLLGLVIRIILGGITYHPDLKAQIIPSIVIFKFHQLDIYEYANWVTPKEMMDKPPLAYLWPVAFQWPFRMFIDDQYEVKFFDNRQSLFGHFPVWLYLLYAKLPLLIFDLLTGVLLTFLVKESQQKKILILWLFNPVTIWATVAIGQVDIYTTFFIALSIYFVKKNNLILSSLALGLGAAIKSSPFLLLPFLLGISKSWKEKLVMVFLTFTPFIISAIPFIHSPKFKENALFAPQMSKSLYTAIPLSGSESLFIVVIALGFIYLLFFSKSRGFYDYITFSLSSLLVVLILTHFHVQWFLWVVPFLLMYFLDKWTNSEKLVVAGFTVSLLMMVFLFDSSLQLKLFAPIYPSLDQAQGLLETLSNDKIVMLRSFSASIFASVSLFLIYRLFKLRQ